MNRALSFGVVAVALAIIVAGCEGGSSLAPEPCKGNVEVTVLPVGQPVFAWSPDCGMSSVAVATVPSTPGAAGTVVWGFTVPENSPVGPGVVYGAAPARASVWTPPVPLEAGTTYRVSVAQTVGGDVLVASGDAVFNR